MPAIQIGHEDLGSGVMTNFSGHVNSQPAEFEVVVKPGAAGLSISPRVRLQARARLSEKPITLKHHSTIRAPLGRQVRTPFLWVFAATIR